MCIQHYMRIVLDNCAETIDGTDYVDGKVTVKGLAANKDRRISFGFRTSRGVA